MNYRISNNDELAPLYFPSAEKEKKEKEMDNKYYYEFQKAIDKYCDNDVIATEAVIKEMDKEKQVNGIKDSGDRTEFATGAVRDIHAGKGRFDLLPWHAIWDVAKHCENGAFKYGERNVNKGIPQHSLIDSAYRHMTEYLLGFKDEEHLRAACWNLLWALEQCTTHPELLDIPWKDEEVVVVAKYEDGSEWIKKSPKPSYCDRCEFDGFIAVECNSCVDGNNYCKEEK